MHLLIHAIFRTAEHVPGMGKKKEKYGVCILHMRITYAHTGQVLQVMFTFNIRMRTNFDYAMIVGTMWVDLNIIETADTIH